MQEWTYRHDVARVDNAGVDKSARYVKAIYEDLYG